MTPHQVNRVMMQGEIAGSGDLYKIEDCPFTPGSRKAKLWLAGFAAGRAEKQTEKQYESQ